MTYSEEHISLQGIELWNIPTQHHILFYSGPTVCLPKITGNLPDIYTFKLWVPGSSKCLLTFNPSEIFRVYTVLIFNNHSPSFITLPVLLLRLTLFSQYFRVSCVMSDQPPNVIFLIEECDFFQKALGV